MKLIFLIALLGVTVIPGCFSIDYEDIECDSFETDSFDSSERPHRPHRPRPPPPPPPPPRPPPPPPAPQCPSGWITFDRQRGRWCVKVVFATIDRHAAQTECARLGATLTGVQDDRERTTIAAEAQRVARLNGIASDSYIWLGAIRKASCPKVHVCRPEDTFQWTDGFTTGIAGFKFMQYEPNGLLRGNRAQQCLQMVVFPFGVYDDQFCVKQMGPKHGLYACGRRP